MKYLFYLVLPLLICCTPPRPISPSIVSQASNTTALLQAISIVNESVVWASGHQATYCKTGDGGASWQSFRIADADSLQFRDIEALSDLEVILLAAGTGKMSQIRKTVDGGNNWKISYLMDHPEGFLDCMSFWDDKTGIAYGDQIDGRLFILRTTDGGDTWKRLDPENLPPALGTEGGFAASGTCVEVREGGLGWIGTGAGEKPRVLITTDYGLTWSTQETPMVSGEAAGITSIQFWDEENGLVVGGDLKQPDVYTKNIAMTSDGGWNWTLAAKPKTTGAFYGAETISYGNKRIAFACGPNGIDYSFDVASGWQNLDSANYWAVEFSNSGIGWAVGKNGKISKISFK